MPATRPEFYKKAEALNVDELVIDLEDSVTEVEKESARESIAEGLAQRAFGVKMVAVRVNAVGTPWFESDIKCAVTCPRVDAIVLPKVGSVADIRVAATQIQAYGRELAIEIQIETAAGLEHVAELANASQYVEALHFGPTDLAASLTVRTNRYSLPPQLRDFALMRILIAARASGRQVVDGPATDLQARSDFENQTIQAARLGLDGKWAIHPNQIGFINSAFTPSEAEVERARSIVSVLRDGQRAGRGALMFDGAMIDEATRRWAESVLARLATDVNH